MIHLMKLAVGVRDIDHLAFFQKRRLADTGRCYHLTRHMPKRADDVLAGGSMFWVIRGQMCVRQRVIGLHPDFVSEGPRRCAIEFEKQLVPVHPRVWRAFQGWRYLEPRDAPADLGRVLAEEGEMPLAMVAELKALGLL